MRKSLLQALGAAVLLLILHAGPALAQAEADAGNGEVPEAEYRLKRITLSVYGGSFSGGKFLELPRPWERTMVAEGSDELYQYDGTLFQNEEYLPMIQKRYYKTQFFAPIKKIEPGTMFGGRIGFYLSEEFHLDIRLSFAKSKATTSLLYDNPADFQMPEPTRLIVDEDKNFKSFLIGTDLSYDLRTLKMFGVTPFIGCGFGGIINRFSYLEDKTALYFQGNLGVAANLSSDVQLSALYMATTFSFTREELFYGKQVTYGMAAAQLTYVIDMIPGD